MSSINKAKPKILKRKSILLNTLDGLVLTWSFKSYPYNPDTVNLTKTTLSHSVVDRVYLVNRNKESFGRYIETIPCTWKVHIEMEFSKNDKFFTDEIEWIAEEKVPFHNLANPIADAIKKLEDKSSNMEYYTKTIVNCTVLDHSSNAITQ